MPVEKIILRYSFYISTIVCLCVFIVIFWSWNKPVVVDYGILGTESKGVQFSIDSCKNHGRYVQIQGWIFNETYPRSGNLTVTASVQGSELKVPVFTYARGDVSTIFNRDPQFDNTGFNASISTLLLKDNHVEHFNFYIKNQDGHRQRILSYECK